jgi:hypothetical protein
MSGSSSLTTSTLRPSNSSPISPSALSTPGALSRVQSSGTTPITDTYTSAASVAQTTAVPTPLAASMAALSVEDAGSTSPKKGFNAGLRTAFAAVGSAAKNVYRGIVNFFALLGRKVSYGVGLLFAKFTGHAQAFKAQQKTAAKAAYAKAAAHASEYAAEQGDRLISLREKFTGTARKTCDIMMSDFNKAATKATDELDSAVAEFTQASSRVNSQPARSATTTSSAPSRAANDAP